MKTKIANKRTLVIFAILTVAWMLFIFSNSLKNAEQSAASSGRIVEFIECVAQKIGIKTTDGETGINTDTVAFFVRKSAHFLEFALLGALAFAVFLQITSPRRAFWSLLLPLAAAITDELLQGFSPGRSAQPTDVLIDISGAAFAACLVFMCKTHKNKKKKTSKTVKTENF